MPDVAVAVRGLRKSYGPVAAVKGIDLEVRVGECFAFLGPNGAGKTTTVETLAGFRQRDAGEVEVLGVDPARGDRRWRDRLGVVLQAWSPQPELTVRETLAMFAGYFRRPLPVDDVIASVGLEAERDRRVGRLSGGQQRRLDVGVALVGDPELLFLDEPTTGFDPAARRRAWDMVSTLRAMDKTIFLTTHYMDEAQHLADRVAIINGGTIVAEGTPADLVRSRRDHTVIGFALPQGVTTEQLPAALRPLVAEAAAGYVIRSQEPVRHLAALTTWALEAGIDLPGLTVGGAELEDVYLELTGSP